MATNGQLALHILEARLTRDTQTFGKMDPYCLIETRMQRFRTTTMTDAGKDPAWPDECMNIDVKYVGDDLHLAVMNENVTSDDSIGEATIKLSSLCIGEGLDEWFEVQHKGTPAGHIHLKSEWSPKGEELTDMPKPEEAERPALVYSNGTVAPPVNYIPPPVMMQAPQYYQQHHPQQYAYTQQQPQYQQQQVMQPMPMPTNYAQVVPLQQVQVIQQTIIVQREGAQCCVDPNCQLPGEFTCMAKYCCKDRGCGGKMCSEHKGKKCQGKQRKHGPAYTVCINCEPEASKWLKIQTAPFLVIFCCILCCMVILVNTQGARNTGCGEGTPCGSSGQGGSAYKTNFASMDRSNL